MTLVGTDVGAPKVEQWKYPFVGDEHVTMIERVIIDVPARKVVRLKMPPDQHRSTCADDLACSEGWEDVQWGPDGKTLAFVRDRKSVVSGKSVSVRVDLGGRRIIKKKTIIDSNQTLFTYIRLDHTYRYSH